MTQLSVSINEKPRKSEWIFYSLQHVFASFGGIVAVPIIFATVLGFDTMSKASLIEDILIYSGIVTIIQSLGFKMLGSKLPQVMGSNFTFIGPGIVVGLAAMEASGGDFKAGYAAILGSSMVAAVVQIILGNFMDKLNKIFPPLVQGCVVSLIGLTMLGVASDWFGGGFSENVIYGAPINLLVGLFVIAIIIICTKYGKGMMSSGSIFWGMLAGYALATSLGMVSFGAVSESALVYFPKPLKYGLTFKISYIIPFLIAYVVSLVESTGDTLACARASEVDLAPERLKGSILLGGLGSCVGALFNSTPTTTFSQNTGIVSLTGVASRYVVAGTGVLLIVLGMFPKFGALVAIMPEAVLGGAGIVMFGTIAAVGVGILKEVEFTKETLMVIGLSLASGLAVTMRPQLLDHVPSLIKTIFSSGITTGTLVAIILNQILIKKGE